MSHRQSCDRCRQQKVRCLRDESQGGANPTPSSRIAISPCERCMKAGVDCVYSLKQRSNRRSSQLLSRKNNSLEPTNLSSTAWLEQGQSGPVYLGGSLGADFANLVEGFHGIDENGTITGADFNGWDTNLQPFSPKSLNSITTLSGADTTFNIVGHSGSDNCEDSSDLDDTQHPTDALASQLTSLSRRATRAMRRLARTDCPPLTVSSPEVNEALEDTNRLIRIINDITTSDRDDETATDYSLAFSALACHQHLISLFRAICDAIHRCLQSKKEQQQQQQQRQYHHTRRPSGSNVGSSSVAQFVMVLQLLMHLINRMDRSLSQNLTYPSSSSVMAKHNNTNTRSTSISTTGGYITPITPDSLDLSLNLNSNLMQYEPASSPSGPTQTTPAAGILGIAHDLMGTIPSEHEKLRLVIQRLQTETEYSELD